MKKEPTVWDIVGAAVFGAIMTAFLMWVFIERTGWK
jgi:hypothetical protein